MNKTAIILSTFFMSCFTTSDLDNRKEGVNFTLNDQKNGINSLYFVKDGEIINQTYNFYKNGLIMSVTLISDSFKYSYIYNKKGQLICNVKSSNVTPLKRMIYISTDSTIIMEATESKLSVSSKTNSFDTFNLVNNHVNIGNFSIELLKGKIMIYKFNYEKDDFELYYEVPLEN